MNGNVDGECVTQEDLSNAIDASVLAEFLNEQELSAHRSLLTAKRGQKTRAKVLLEVIQDLRLRILGLQ